jgi:hypothetical protein
MNHVWYDLENTIVTFLCCISQDILTKVTFLFLIQIQE